MSARRQLFPLQTPDSQTVYLRSDGSVGGSKVASINSGSGFQFHPSETYRRHSSTTLRRSSFRLGGQ